MCLRYGRSQSGRQLEISKYVLSNGIADYVLVGGVTSQLFLAAKGIDLGKPTIDYLAHKELTQFIPGIKALIDQFGEKVKTPLDLAINIYGDRSEITIADLPTQYSIFDLGHKTIESYAKIIKGAKSIVVSGPMGVYENPQFNYGTKGVLKQSQTAKPSVSQAAETQSRL